MSQTQLWQNIDSTVATYNSGTPGPWTSVAGTVYSGKIGGPYTAGIPSLWSSDGFSSANFGLGAKCRKTIYVDYPTAVACGNAGSWLYITSKTGGANDVRLFELRNGVTQGNPTTFIDQQGFRVCINSSNNFKIEVDGGTGADNVSAVPLNQWFWLQVSWKRNSFWVVDFNVHTKTVGGSLTLLGSYQATTAGYWGQDIRDPGGFADFSTYSTGGVSSVQCRRGGATICSMTALADVAYPTGLSEPVNDYSALIHRFNPDTGDDTADGLPATPWKTADKFNTELVGLGVMPGCTVEIDTSTASMDLSTVAGAPTQLKIGQNTSTYEFYKSPAKLTGLNGGTFTLKPWKNITGTWAKTATYNYIYETTDESATDLTSTVTLEDDVCPGHVETATLATALTAMDAKPTGEYWMYTDGTKIYIKASGNTNPSTNGKTYRRSRYYIDADSVIGLRANFYCTDLIVDGMVMDLSLLCNKTTGHPERSQPVMFSDAKGSCALKNANLTRWGVHAYSVITRESGCTWTSDGNVLELGTPYSADGIQTVMAFQPSNNIAGNVFNINDETSVYNVMLAQSTSGAVDFTQAYSAIHAPDADSSVATSINFTNCNISSVISGSSAVDVTISNSSTGGSDIGSTNLTVTGSPSHGYPYGFSGGGVLKIIDSNMNVSAVHTSDHWSTLACSAKSLIENCIIDLTGNTTSETNTPAIWKKDSATSLNFFLNTVLIPSTKNFTVFGGFDNTDTLNMNMNKYSLGPANLVLDLYNDGSTTADRTLAQLRAFTVPTQWIGPYKEIANTIVRKVNYSSILKLHDRPSLKSLNKKIK